jgi:hypothetical protein
MASSLTARHDAIETAPNLNLSIMLHRYYVVTRNFPIDRDRLLAAYTSVADRQQVPDKPSSEGVVASLIHHAFGSPKPLSDSYAPKLSMDLPPAEASKLVNVLISWMLSVVSAAPQEHARAKSLLECVRAISQCTLVSAPRPPCHATGLSLSCRPSIFSYYVFAASKLRQCGVELGDPSDALHIQAYYESALTAMHVAPSQALRSVAAESEWHMQPLLPSAAPVDFSLLLGWMLTVDPAQRPTAKMLLE